MRDKLEGNDEPYYDSSDPDSFESESDLEGEGDLVSDDDVDGEDNMGQLRGRKKINRVVYDPSAKAKKGITMTCSICKASTHNMRSCPTIPTTNQETTNCSQQSTTKTSQKRGRKESNNASTSKASTSTGGKSGGRGGGGKKLLQEA
nr:uncharacterized protein LOC104108632 isoform X1 [Nicotiana tomentosiformis]